MAASPLGARYVGEMDRLFDTYARLVPVMQEWFTARYPNEAGDSDFVHRQSIRAKAFECGLEARQMLYAGVVRTLEQYRPERVQQLIASTRQVADALAYLRAVVHPSDELAVRRIINYPARGIGRTTVLRLAELARTDPSLGTSVDSLKRKAAELDLEGGGTPPPPSAGEGYRPPWLDDPDDIASKVHRRNAELAAMAADAARAGEQAKADRAARQEALDQAGAEYAQPGGGLTATQTEILSSGEDTDRQIAAARQAGDFMLASVLERRKQRES